MQTTTTTTANWPLQFQQVGHRWQAWHFLPQRLLTVGTMFLLGEQEYTVDFVADDGIYGDILTISDHRGQATVVVSYEYDTDSDDDLPVCVTLRGAR